MSVWILYHLDRSLSSIRQLTKEVPPALAVRDLPPGPAGTARTGREA